MTDESEFLSQVQSWTECLVLKGERDFASLVSRLPGVDPILVATVLKHLIDSGGGSPYQLLHDQACRPTVRETNGAAVPFVPHPVDFDWRFTPSCALELTGQILALTRPGRIALLGTPTLVSAIESSLPPSALRLFDKNSLWTDRIGRQDPMLKVTACDLTLDRLAADNLAAADVVIMDPPWYSPIQKAYLWAAIQLIRPGGFVVTTVPPQGTRPRIRAERADIEAYADSAGLALVSATEGLVRYVTPPFEANAMRAAGVFQSLPDWRSGDLAIYQSRRNVALERPVVATSESRWAEVMIRGVRIKMRLPAGSLDETAESPELEPLVPGDVLPSVSARHPLRKLVDVWTSGNRVFKCKNTRALLELCEPLGHNTRHSDDRGDNSAQSSMNTSATERAVNQILGIVAMESDEYLSGR
jgi:hypothetical protein